MKQSLHLKLFVTAALLFSANCFADKVADTPAPVDSQISDVNSVDVDPAVYLPSDSMIEIVGYSAKTKFYHVKLKEADSNTEFYVKAEDLIGAVKGIDKTTVLKKPLSILRTVYKLDEDLEVQN